MSAEQKNIILPKKSSSGKKKRFRRSIFHKTVNFFVFSFVFVIVILMLAVGFAQTSWFRSIAKDEIVKAVNKKINGEFFLDSIEGTFLNSIKLDNFGIVVEGDTLFSCKEAFVKLSLQAILARKIYLSDILIDSPEIRLLEKSKNLWNYSTLIKHNKENVGSTTKKEVISKGKRKSAEFLFTFEVGNFQIRKGVFIVKDVKHLTSDSLYHNINYGDIKVKNFNFAFNVVADFNEESYAIFLKHLSFVDNLTRFNLKKAKGVFFISPKSVEVKSFNLVTDSSDIAFSAMLKGLNIFRKIKYRKFKDYQTSVKLSANAFAFSDLSTFIPSVEFLKGKIKADFVASGKYGNLKIETLNLRRNYTDLRLKGKLKNLENPKKLFIDAQISDSKIKYEEITDLLSGLHLPAYQGITLDSVTISYTGEPKKFKADLETKLAEGKLKAKTYFDFTGRQMNYNIKLITDNLNLKPLINKSTVLNISASAIGKGVKPKMMKNKIKLNLENSSINGYKIDYLSLNTHSSDGLSEVGLSCTINGANLTANSRIGLLSNNKEYSLSARVRNLDLTKLTFDSTLTSNLNFNVDFSSATLEKNNAEGDLNVKFDSSLFRGSSALSNTHWQVSFWGDSLKKNFDLESELMDAFVEGNFNYYDVPIVVAKQGKRIVQLFSDEIKKQFFAHSKRDTLQHSETALNLPKMNLKYDFLLKNSDILEKILNLNKLEVNGYFKGTVKNDKDKFIFKNNTFFNRFILVDNSKLFFTNNFQFETNIENLNNENDLMNPVVYAKLSADNFYLNKEIKRPSFLMDYRDKNLRFNFSGTLDTNYYFATKGEVSLTDSADEIDFENLSINSNGIKWGNRNSFNLSASHGALTINGFNLYSDSAFVGISGSYNKNGNNDISAIAKNVALGKILFSVFGKRQKNFSGTINLTGKLTGQTSSPKLDLNLQCERFSFSGKEFGNISLNESYEKGTSNISLLLKDNSEVEHLSLTGNLPYSILGEENKLPKEMNLVVNAKDFDLSAVASFIPALANEKGKLNSSIVISRNLSNPLLNGYVKISHAKFKVINTGIDYELGSDIKLDSNLISINRMFVRAGKSSKLKGRINFSGSFLFDRYKFKKFSVFADGNLPLLDERSKYVSPNFYGNLNIGTKGKLKIVYKGDRAVLTGDLIIKQGDITITNENSTTAVDVSNINYVYKVDSTGINQTELFLKNYLAEKFNDKVNDNTKKGLLDYDMNLSIENRATLTFIFSKAVNQKLYVVTNGSLSISDIKGNQSVQGTFNLLPGSRMEFFKTFDATGYVRFEGDLANPYFNIEAVYEGNYTPPATTTTETEKLVAVKIKLDGSLKELAKKIATDKSNISVYVGKKNIDNNVSDPQLSASDAFSFILTGKFSRDLTSNEKYQLSNELTSTATSMLGSVMAGFINAQVGDFINDIQVRQSYYQTKVTLKGRVGGFYYSVGGSQQVFQDLSTATWRLEYFFNKNLSFRVERREPLTGYFSNTQMTDEIAIKYKVTF